MGNRIDTRNSSVPGPGQYNPKEDGAKAVVPAYAIGKAKRMNSKESGVPGPGAYDSSPGSTGPKWKVGTQPRLNVSLENIPGPGTYDCSSEMSMPAYSMTARRPATSGSSVPGPGTYSPKHFFSSINYSVGNAKRNSHSISDVPGPASYNIESPKTRGAKIGSSKRDWIFGNCKNPGPGAYETHIAWQGPKFSLRSKHRLKTANENPVILI